MRQLAGGMLVIFAISISGAACAQSCTTYPYNIQNGTTADANQVMADMHCAALTGAGMFWGNVGINTGSPNFALDVVAVGGGLAARLGGGASQNGMVWDAAGGGDQFYLTTFSHGFSIFDNTAGHNDIVVDNAGRVGIGTDVPNVPLQVFGDISLDTTGSNPRTLWFRENTGLNGMAITSNVGSAPGGLAIIGSGGGTLSAYFARQGNVGIGTQTPSMRFYVNGTAGGTGAWTVASDARLKTGVVEISDALGLVQRLRGVRFKWRADADRQVGHGLSLPPGEVELGLVAQEVAAVVPEAVSVPAASDGIYGLKEASLVAVLVEAVKEQQAQIVALRSRVEALEHRAQTTVAAN